MVSLGAPDASAAAEGPAAASEALLARRREAVGEVHPRLRLALTLPWVGSTFPSWFPYFLASTNRSSYLVDWLIFHEEARLPPAGEVPPRSAPLTLDGASPALVSLSDVGAAQRALF